MFGMGTGVALSTQPPENFSTKTHFGLCTLAFVRSPKLKLSTQMSSVKDLRSKFKELISFGSGGLVVTAGNRLHR